MRFFSLRITVLLATLVAASHLVQAADPITFTLGRFETSPACGAPCAEFIVAKGEITQGAGFGYFLARAKTGNRDLPVILESPGGYVNGAIALAKGWRQLGVTVVIATAIPTCSHKKGKPRCIREDATDGVQTFGLGGNAKCASACTMLMAGGTRRIATAGTKFGIHTPGIDLDAKTEQNLRKLKVKREDIQKATLQRVVRHFRDLDIDPELGIRSGRTPYEDMEWLTRDEARHYRLLNAAAADLTPDSPLSIMLRAIGGP